MTGSALEPLAHQPFRWLVAARTVAVLGNIIAPVALAFAVLDLTGSPAALGLVLAARSVPQVVFMLAGGVVADRWSRRRVFLVAALVSALAQALAAAVVLTGTASVGMLAGIEAVNGAASAFIFPAAAGLTPLTVPATLLQQANALLRLGLNGATILGAAAGGLLVAAVGPGWGLAVDAVTFVLAAALLVPLRVVQDAPLEVSSVWGDLRAGWREVRTRTWLWVVVLAFALANAGYAATLGVLGPVIADDSIGRAGWGLVLAAQSAGLVLGGVLALRVALRHPLRAGLLAALMSVPLFVVLAVAPTLAPLLLLAVLAGIGAEVFSIGWDVALQENVPTDRLSRVYSFDALGSFVLIPAGQALVGPAAAAVGAQTTVLAAAAVSAVCLLGALAVPSVRNLGRIRPATPLPATSPVS
jgi:MFS family permease